MVIQLPASFVICVPPFVGVRPKHVEGAIPEGAGGAQLPGEAVGVGDGLGPGAPEGLQQPALLTLHELLVAVLHEVADE